MKIDYFERLIRIVKPIIYFLNGRDEKFVKKKGYFKSGMKFLDTRNS